MYEAWLPFVIFVVLLAALVVCVTEMIRAKDTRDQLMEERTHLKADLHVMERQVLGMGRELARTRHRARSEYARGKAEVLEILVDNVDLVDIGPDGVIHSITGKELHDDEDDDVLPMPWPAGDAYMG